MAPRARQGSVKAHLLLRLPPEIREALKREAEREGISDTEWIRRAIRNELLRAAHRLLTGERKRKAT